MNYNNKQIRIGTRKFKGARNKTAISYTSWAVNTPSSDEEIMNIVGTRFDSYIDLIKKALNNDGNVVILQDVYTDNTTYQVITRYAELQIENKIVSTFGNNQKSIYLN